MNFSSLLCLLFPLPSPLVLSPSPFPHFPPTFLSHSKEHSLCTPLHFPLQHVGRRRKKRMLHSTLGAFLPPPRPVRAASDSDSPSAFSCLRLKDLGEEVAADLQDTLEIRGSLTRLPNRSNNSRKAEQGKCSLSVVETTNTSAVTTTSVFSRTSSSFLAPRSMWQEAIRRKRYFLDRTGESGERDKGGGGQERRSRSPDWLYESYYCMSQQHPLIVFLLLIVMGACLALLTVFFASGLVSCSFTT